MNSQLGELNPSVPLVADPVGTVASLTELIRAEGVDMDTTRRVPTTELHFELAGRHLLGRDIVSSAWAIDDRSET